MPPNAIRANPGGGIGSPSDLSIGTNQLIGRGSGALDGISLGAGLSITANVLNAAGGTETAAELLAKIATVDGDASGLDADMIDGQHAAAFATAAQGALAGTASQPGHVHDQADVTGLSGALAGKQDVLTSGTTIKTVGGVSLMGAGDIPLPSGGGGGASPIISWAI